MTEIETLTEEERDWLQRFRHCPWPDVSRSAADAGVDAGAALRKLLRLHDALQARVKELEERGVPADGMCRGATCGRKNRALPMHSCPYREEISDDPLTLCSCCEECQRECAMDI